MKKITMLALFFAPFFATQAALPPRAQNWRDLQVMNTFISQHDHVAATLKKIDLTKFEIHFGERNKDCRALFGRKKITRPPGFKGPAAPLEFKSATCPVKEK